MAIPSGDERFFNRLQRAIERTVKFELNEYQISKESWWYVKNDVIIYDETVQQWDQI